jgi:UDP-glucose:(heptosyl)LPS alpha-1,3-glucosyltransferase
LKIGLIILHADPNRGGAERYTADLAAVLRRRGHEASLIASSFGPGQQAPQDVLLDTGSRTRLGAYLQFLDLLDPHLINNRYDIVHAMLPVRNCDVYHPHAGMAAEAITGGHLKHEGPMMQMVSRVATRLNRRRQRFAMVERLLLTKAHPPVVLCLSEYVKRNVRRHYELKDERLPTLFNAVDLERFNPRARPDAGRLIRERFGIKSRQIVGLMIAQDFARKGLREAIVAAAALRDASVTLLVVGKQDPAPYRRLAEQSGIGQRVIFAGQTDDPYAFYRAADLFLLPTRHDPCSLVVLEALAMGLPVISTARNGACEIMTGGVHGFVIDDPADIASTSNAIRSLMDETKRAAMAAACRELRPRLAYEHHLDALCRIYDGVRAQI